jgi:hypothetical protein
MESIEPWVSPRRAKVRYERGQSPVIAGLKHSPKGQAHIVSEKAGLMISSLR